MAETRTPNKIIDIKRLCLFTDGVEDKKARFQFAVREGHPRISVFTGAKGRDGVIQGPIDSDGMMVFCTKLREVAAGPVNNKYSLSLKTMQYEDNKPTGKTTLVSTLFCGKDESGMVWVGLQAEGKPKIKFTFQFSDFMELKKADGSSPSAEEMSCLIAISYAKLIEDIIPMYMLHYTFTTLDGANIGAPAAKIAITDFPDIDF